jgi:hypothetical protein
MGSACVKKFSFTFGTALAVNRLILVTLKVRLLITPGVIANLTFR